MGFWDNIGDLIPGFRDGRYVYDTDAMEEMIERLRKMIEQLEASEDTVKTTAAMIHDQELLAGDGADALHAAMATTFPKIIDSIRNDAEEQLKRIETELAQFREFQEQYRSELNS